MQEAHAPASLNICSSSVSTLSDVGRISSRVHLVDANVLWVELSLLSVKIIIKTRRVVTKDGRNRMFLAERAAKESMVMD